MNYDWCSIVATDDDMDAKITGAIAYAFEELLSENESRDMAIFVQKGSRKFFFSPAAHHVGLALGAQPCAVPSRDDLLLIAGNANRAWQLNAR